MTHPAPTAIRAEMLAGERCPLCETTGRTLALARTDYVLLVACTVCWCEVVVALDPGPLR